MADHFSEIKKLLPGIILGLIFIGAFALGIQGFGGGNPTTATPTQLSSDSNTAASNVAPAPNQADTAPPVLVSSSSTEVVASTSDVAQVAPDADLTTAPVVAPETAQTTQPVLDKKPKEEGEKKASGKEHEDKEGDDD